MKRSKLINTITLLSIFIFSGAAIYFYLNYAYIFLHDVQYFLDNYVACIFVNHKVSIFFLEIIWLFLLYIIIKKSTKIKLLFVITIIAFNLIYMFWRIKYTIPTSNKLGMILGVMLIIAELIGFFQSVIYSVLFYKPYKLKEMKMSDLNRLPTIDVLIMTYNEPSYILRKTIAGCLNIEYPSNLLNIYICDDGHRDEIKKLAEFFNIHYVTRDNNDSAKAGNINNALSNYCKGELFSVLDADMIPKPNYLEKMVGYFKDNNVGFIQSPQVFYNPDPFQYNLNLDNKIPNEQDFFMREVQAGRARYNALFHVGTNALFSRQAIDDIGGIPTGSITEDMATGMILQAKGYKSIFVNEVLAIGLSAEYYKDFAKQRKRWCRGNIQVSKKWNPLIMKGLTPIQRLLYFSGILYWYSGVLKMIYMLCPIIYLLAGTLIIKANTMQLLQFFVPSYMSYILMFKSHSSKYRSLILTHIYESATAPFLALASLSELIFSKELKFNVTLKGNIKKNIFVSWNLLLPQLILFIATVFGFGISLNKLMNTNSVALKESLIINIAWASYNLIGMIMIMLLSLEKPRYRKSERKIVNGESTLILANSQSMNCTIKNISDSGIGISISNNKIDNLDIGDIIKVMIGKNYAFSRIIRCNENSFGCRFVNLSEKQYLNIIKFIFADENGYYNVENKKLTYRKLNSAESNNLIEHERDDDIFVNNVAVNAFSNSETKMNISYLTNSEVVNEKNVINNKPIEAAKEEISISSLNKTNKSYADLSIDEVLKNILKLNNEKIVIIKMYEELTEMKKKLVNSHN
ncbi:MAG: glycosyltransferase family 2 protein [Clostridium sp.]|uniref:glycosyltransferase n=1 Tax=Clostridium sp. TaxID=1506 RepID=UPI0039E767A6